MTSSVVSEVWNHSWSLFLLLVAKTNGRRRWVTKKRLWWALVALLCLVVWSIGVYSYAVFRTSARNTPTAAVQRYLVRNHWDFPHKKILPTTTPTNGGYFMVVQLRQSMYQIFYVWVNKGDWEAANTFFAFNPNSRGMSEDFGVPYDMQKAGQNNWMSAVINTDKRTAAVVSYVEVGKADIPFSMVQLAQFNVWVCRYPTHITMPVYYVGHDRDGKVLWTTKH